jgi:acetyl-CoA C-acetyltransferase
MTQFDERAPVIIGVGEASRRTVPGDWPSPRDLAGAAITSALADTGQPQATAAAIDTIAAIRTFEDSGISMGTGSPDNVPEAFGAAGGVQAAQLIYADIGGQSPQALVGELAGAIRRGEVEVALIVGAEANGTAKRARKAGVELDWRLPSDTPLDNRLSAFPILDRTEIRHGIVSMPLAYSLMENAIRIAAGRSPEQHSAGMSALWAAFSERSLARDHAQFARRWSEEELARDAQGNYRLTDIYRRWHVAQDAVDLGGAIILASAGKARELGVAPGRMVWLAGAAETREVPYSGRADLVAPVALDHALHAALDQAGLTATDLGPVDIYSCFPVAVSAAIAALRDPARAPGDYTLTGGLSFFGGPGNGYALYSIAAMVEALRRDGSKSALITANGGVMSKQAVGIYSAHQPERPWSGEIAGGYAASSVALEDAPQGNARILTFARPVVKDVPGPASLIVELENGARAMAVWDDAPDADLGAMRVAVTAGEKRHIAEPIG